MFRTITFLTILVVAFFLAGCATTAPNTNTVANANTNVVTPYPTVANANANSSGNSNIAAANTNAVDNRQLPGFGRAKRCIFLFMWGGPSQLDTFDPKPDAPLEIRGPTKPIATAVPGIRIAETLPRLAARADKLAFVRSVHHRCGGHRNGAYWNLTGHAPAVADFADEDDVPEDVAGRARGTLSDVASEMDELLADGRRGEITRDGLRVAIIGPPNVGKSTLLNALAERDVAIVSPLAGTTRDVIEVRLDLDGYVVVLADTAGLRESADAIETEGIARARRRAAESDLRLFVGDLTSPDSLGRVGLEMESLARPGDILFLNKADAATGDAAPPSGPVESVQGSARAGDLGGLLDLLRRRLSAQAGQGSVLITRARHREALQAAHDALMRAQAADGDLAAEDVRLSLQALARIVGRFDVEAVLDRIFSAFCIGK